jgi:hemerythrin-like domain-containing protein
MSPSSSEFKNELQRLKEMTLDHVRQEENTMFAAIRNNCSSEQSEKLASDFKAAKDRLQQQMASKMQ